MMTVSEVLDSYVRDVAACLPRERRDDVALELRALLDEELQARASEAGRPADRELALALLEAFGRPAEVAQRYHARPALVNAADTHRFVMLGVSGAIVLVLHAALHQVEIDFDGLLLQWLGLLVLGFAVVDWLRRIRPGLFRWKPRRGPEWMPRWLSAFTLACALAFPVFMYAAPVPFARLLMPAAVPVDGLTLTEPFAGSVLRLVTMALLMAFAAEQGAALLLGSRPAWLRRFGAGSCFTLGGLLVVHASTAVFVSSVATEVARPIFLSLGGLMLLTGMFYGWQEWTTVRPAPVRS